MQAKWDEMFGEIVVVEVGMATIEEEEATKATVKKRVTRKKAVKASPAKKAKKTAKKKSVAAKKRATKKQSRKNL